MNTAPGELLALWECAASALPLERDDALLHALDDEPPTSLGARNAALLGLRTRLLGRSQLLRCNCPACDAVAEFTVDCESLSQALLPAPEAMQPQRLDMAGFRIDFHVPSITDFRAAAGVDDASFEQTLFQRCITRCERGDGSACAPDELPQPVADALSQRMEELEPGASVSFDLTCPECGHTWSATMDVGDVLWSELQTRAERLLLEVDALARAYGWSEEQVLALSPTRRAAYLQLVGAG